MLTKRVIACLDVKDGRVVKGVHFRDLRDVGDPVALAERYEREGVDEIVFLDVSATVQGRGTILQVARRTAERVFVPLVIGGGIRTVDDMDRALRAGADKVAVNSAAVAHPELLTQGAARYGSQCVVVSIDAKRHDTGWEVYVKSGSEATGLDAVAWARECVRRGAGEILLTSIDRDGKRTGYDLELTRAVARAVTVPVIASGGAGDASHVVEVLTRTGADAALLAGVLHDGGMSARDIKDAARASGLPVRLAP